MKFRQSIIIVYLLMLTTLSSQTAYLQAPPQRVVGYYASWTYPTLPVAEIRGDLLTHINYAFVGISPDLECDHIDRYADLEYRARGDGEHEIAGNFRQLVLLKAQYPHLGVLLGLGGYTDSARFSDAALTEESRLHFARSCVALMQQYGFDGLDVDWEFPVMGGMAGNVERPADRANFTLLLAALRNELDRAGDRYLLTAAISAYPRYHDNYEFPAIMESLDWINLMTYDYAGGWSQRTGFLAPLYGESSADASVRSLLERGVDPADIVLGVPFYGVGWSGVTDEDDGLYQPFAGLSAGTLGAGSYSYASLAAPQFESFTRFWNDEAQAAWLYNAERQTMISYEDPEALARKGIYMREMGLGGMMTWELSQDDAENTLLSIMHNAVFADR
jgi:chitinase